MKVSNRTAFLYLHQQGQLVLFTLLQNSYSYLQRQERGKDWRKGDREERGGMKNEEDRKRGRREEERKGKEGGKKLGCGVFSHEGELL